MITLLRIRKADPRLVLGMRGPAGNLVALAESGNLSAIVAVIGPVGPGGAGAPFVHTQSAASAAWTVNHNRGWKPASVSVLTPGGVEMNADIIHVSNNQILVNFAQPQTGSVLVN